VSTKPRKGQDPTARSTADAIREQVQHTTELTSPRWERERTTAQPHSCQRWSKTPKPYSFSRKPNGPTKPAGKASMQTIPARTAD
jgi:hypothetical protein